MKYVIEVYNGIYYKSPLEDTDKIEEAKLFEKESTANNVKYQFCLSESVVRKVDENEFQ